MERRQFRGASKGPQSDVTPPWTDRYPKDLGELEDGDAVTLTRTDGREVS